MAVIPLGHTVAFYNKFYFPKALNAVVNTQPVMSANGRTVRSTQHTITLEFLVYPGVDESPAGVTWQNMDGTTYVPLFPASTGRISAAMGTLRRILMTAGKAFAFEENTFADVWRVGPTHDSTLSTGWVDVGGGPKPQAFSWERIAGEKAARVRWTVLVETAECNGGVGGSPSPTDRVGDLTYALTWSIDELGMTTRSIRGSLYVAAPIDTPEPPSTQTQKYFTDNADNYRERLVFPVPEGFRRVGQTYSLSADRQSLDFDIVDAEHASDVPLDEGIVDANVQVSLQNSLMPGLDIGTQSWDVTISGTITVAKGVHRCRAWLAFLKVVQSRLDAAAAEARIPANDEPYDAVLNPETQDGAGIRLLYGMQWVEDVFGRSMTFSLSYLLTASVRTVIAASGMWVPLTADDEQAWLDWKTSHTVTYDTWKHRGHANLTMVSGEEDMILSFCDPTQSFAYPNDTMGAAPTAPTCDPINENCPEAKDSWLMFDVNVEQYEQTYNVWHKRLDPRGGTSFGSTLTKTSVGNNLGSSPGAGAPPIKQSRSGTTYRLRYSGRALRLGYQIPRPILLSYGGLPTTPEGTLRFKQKKTKTYEGCPLYQAEWEGFYIIEGYPAGDVTIIDPDPRKIVQ